MGTLGLQSSHGLLQKEMHAIPCLSQREHCRPTNLTRRTASGVAATTTVRQHHLPGIYFTGRQARDVGCHAPLVTATPSVSARASSKLPPPFMLTCTNSDMTPCNRQHHGARGGALLGLVPHLPRRFVRRLWRRSVRHPYPIIAKQRLQQQEEPEERLVQLRTRAGCLVELYGLHGRPLHAMFFARASSKDP